MAALRLPVTLPRKARNAVAMSRQTGAAPGVPPAAVSGGRLSDEWIAASQPSSARAT
jgi:hypothetical protein